MKDNNKKLTEHKLSDLVMAIFNHPNTPNWLSGKLWDAINDNAYMNPYNPTYLKLMIKESGLDNREVENDS